MDATWPPMEYINNDGEIEGFTVDYLNAVGKEAGFRCEFINVSWDHIFKGLSDKKYDIVASSVSITND